MSDLLRTRPASTAEMLAVFSDAATLRHALAFEGALARAQAAHGLISAAAAAEITEVCRSIVLDPDRLADEAAHAGTLAIPLVRALRAELGPESAQALHRGATSQDVADTVMMLQARDGVGLLLADCGRVCAALFALAQRFAATPAMARTLLQDARPIGFGLRLAQAGSNIRDATRRLVRDAEDALRLQLGGPAGTRAGFGGQGAAIAARMAKELGLAPALPWHARRAGVAGLAAAIGIVIGALGKFARDVGLLSQNAVGEAREPRLPGRGGSSAMPHKRNPTGAQVALSAALRAPGLVAAMIGALPQEEERGLGGWQAEGPVLADLFLLAGGSAAAMAVVAEGLEVDTAAIARNLSAADQGQDIGESEALVAALIAQYQQG